MDVLDTREDSVINKVEKSIDEEQLYNKLGELSPREKKVLELRYGLLDGKRLTQKEVASILGISRSYVSRIEKKGYSGIK